MKAKISKKAIIERVRKKVKLEDLTKLSLAIMEGDEEEAGELSESAVKKGLSVRHMLRSCYEGLRATGELHRQGLCERADLMIAVEAFLVAIAPFKEGVVKRIRTGTILLGVMESDGQWAATAYTLPLLKAFGHKVHMVASYYPKFYIEKLKDIQPEKPDIVCITTVPPGGKYYIKDIVDSLKEFGLREGANSDPQEYVVEKAFVG